MFFLGSVNFTVTKLKVKNQVSWKIYNFYWLVQFGCSVLFWKSGILNIKKTENINDYYCEYSKILDKTIKEENVKEFLNKVPNEKTLSYKSLMINENLIDNTIVFLDNDIKSILNKIEEVNG